MYSCHLFVHAYSCDKLRHLLPLYHWGRSYMHFCIKLLHIHARMAIRNWLAFCICPALTTVIDWCIVTVVRVCMFDWQPLNRCSLCASAVYLTDMICLLLCVCLSVCLYVCMCVCWAALPHTRTRTFYCRFLCLSRWSSAWRSPCL